MAQVKIKSESTQNKVFLFDEHYDSDVLVMGRKSSHTQFFRSGDGLMRVVDAGDFQGTQTRSFSVWKVEGGWVELLAFEPNEEQERATLDLIVRFFKLILCIDVPSEGEK